MVSGTARRAVGEDNTSQPLVAEATGLEESSASAGQWETEYEAQVKAWRAESAEAREKAERERQRWATIRESEQQQPRTESEWENVSEERGATGGHEKDIPSIESSFPSIEIVDTPPHREPHPPHPQEPTSVTMAIFDTTLTTRTRVTALCSSLAINLLLPFVNGVMLGFGEIFAKNIVLEWLGWRTGGEQQRQQQRRKRRWT